MSVSFASLPRRAEICGTGDGMVSSSRRRVPEIIVRAASSGVAKAPTATEVPSSTRAG